MFSFRPLDNSTEGFQNWEFMTAHCWGEQAAGEWTLKIQDTPSQKKDGSKLGLLFLFVTSQYYETCTEPRLAAVKIQGWASRDKASYLSAVSQGCWRSGLWWFMAQRSARILRTASEPDQLRFRRIAKNTAVSHTPCILIVLSFPLFYLRPLSQQLNELGCGVCLMWQALT